VLNAPTASRPLVAFVDDEPAVVDALRRGVTDLARVLTFTDPVAAVPQITEHADDLSVIVSDLRMPGLSGTDLLAACQQAAPDVSRILLTGFADLETAVDAIARAKVFRLLLKPCPIVVVRDALQDGIEQARLRRAERDLLELTLRGAVDALSETLALASPAAYSRAVRIRRVAVDLAEQMQVPQPWEIAVAAPLSLLGAAALPPATLRRLHDGAALSVEEAEQVADIQRTTQGILDRIPRLERVARIIGRAASDDPSSAHPTESPDILLGATILAVATGDDSLASRGLGPGARLSVLGRRFRSATGAAVVTHLARSRSLTAPQRLTLVVPVAELIGGMRLQADLATAHGVLLLGRGQQINATILLHLRHHREELDMSALVPVEMNLPGLGDA
jgi:FixJ family two-component response regulator